MEQLTIAIFLSVVVKSVIDAIIAPLIRKFPAWDWWFLPYPTWVLGGILAWVAGVNLFTGYLPNDFVARLLTAVVVGGGSSLIADLFGSATDNKWKYTRKEEDGEG
jgi:hypothetical protein